MIKLEEKFNKYYESLLVEDIAAVRKQYPKISDEDFNKLIKLDPTYIGNNSVGKFTKWLLNQFNKGNLKFEGDSLMNGNNSFNDRLQDYLEAQKNTSINKDINSFKTPDELVNAILNAEDKELTQRQINRRQKKASNEVKKVYEDENFDIYIPLTFAGSVYIGKGTNWCTAAQTENGMENWQEYTNMDTDGGTYFDAKDDPIKVAEFLYKYPDIYNFFYNENEKNGYIWDNEFYRIHDIITVMDNNYTWELGSEDVIESDAYGYVKHIVVLEEYEPVNGGNKLTSDDFANFDSTAILSLEIPDNFNIEVITILRLNHLQTVKCVKGSQVEDAVDHANYKYIEHKIPHKKIGIEYIK